MKNKVLCAARLAIWSFIDCYDCAMPFYMDMIWTEAPRTPQIPTPLWLVVCVAAAATTPAATLCYSIQLAVVNIEVRWQKQYLCALVHGHLWSMTLAHLWF